MGGNLQACIRFSPPGDSGCAEEQNALQNKQGTGIAFYPLL